MVLRIAFTYPEFARDLLVFVSLYGIQFQYSPGLLRKRLHGLADMLQVGLPGRISVLLPPPGDGITVIDYPFSLSCCGPEMVEDVVFVDGVHPGRESTISLEGIYILENTKHGSIYQ